MDGAASTPETPELPEGTVTVLFSDVEGSTDLRTREGDDVAQGVMRTHEQMLREQIDLFGGREVVFMGDGFMVAFGSARKAIECAVGIQRCFEKHNLAGPDHLIKVRIGLNTGEVLRESGTLYGTSVNAAARISAKAKGGQILISQVTKDLTTGVRDFAFLDRGMFPLKGFPSQWRLYEVAWREGEERPVADVPSAPARETPPAPARSLLEETYIRSGRGPLVGRVAERLAIEKDLDAVAGGGIRVYAVDGEAGIGKTRIIEAAVEGAASKGFGAVIVGGDEELRGPFFILRTLLASDSIQALAEQAMARDALEAARDVVGGRGRAEVGFSPAEQMLRVYDVATIAIRAIAEARPLALLFDDLQWADEDSLKLIRYLVRTSSTSPIFIMLAQRPAAGPGVSAGTSLIADLERMGLARSTKLERLTRGETAELLGNLLGTPPSQETAAALHARGEGVPFFMVEFAQAFRDAGLMQVVGGKLELSQAARSTVAPNVQILIERRLAQLESDARRVVSDAAVIGRRFALGELSGVLAALDGGEERGSGMDLADRLDPAVEANLLVELPEAAANDYAFTHDEIRSALIAQVPRRRRRAIHGALARRMEAALDEGATCSATLAFHFLEAGEQDDGVRYSIRTARDSLNAFAAEEALRAVDLAREAAQSPEDRSELLRLRDDALEALARPEERLATLSEMSALARALGDEALELEATLRRASATRQTEDYDEAGEIAIEAQTTAVARGDLRAELRACLELGQARTHRSLGDAYSLPTSEVDVDAAGEAFDRALELATELGDDAAWAAVRREQGVIAFGKGRKFVLMLAEQNPDLFADPTSDPREIPEIRDALARARELYQEAVDAYERLGDQRGITSSLIGLAYANILEEAKHGHAGRIEQIRLLRRNLTRLTSEAERAESDTYMLFSIAVYARSHGPLDLGLMRGIEAYEAGRALRNRAVELFAAGGVALTYAMLAQIPEAESWLDKAGGAAVATTDALPARQLETWRGQVRAAAGDAAGMRRHLERALTLATERGSPGGRAEVLGYLAVEGARLGADQGDADLLAAAEEWAQETLRMSAALPPSDAPFEGQGHAALAQIALARGDREGAFEHALAGVVAFKRIRQIFAFLYLEPRLLLARATRDLEDPQVAEFRMQARGDVQVAVWQTADDAVRARWLRTPMMNELLSLVGGDEAVMTLPSGAAVPAGLTTDQVDLLRRVMTGQSNREIAAATGADEDQTSREIARIFQAIGASTRGQASAAALREGIV